MRILSTLVSALMLVTAMNPVPVATADDDDSRGNRERGRSSSAKLIVPLTGTVVSGGTFTGSFSILRFENRAGTIHAVGMVSGVVSGPNARSGISGPLAMPVTVTADQPLAKQTAVIAQAGCEIHLSFGGLTLNLLGVDVVLSPITIDLVAGAGPLGNLIQQICTLLNTAGDIVGLVTNLLNTLLGLLGGIVGGVA